VTTVRFGVRKFERIRREHALILACACVLFLNFPSARFNPAAVDFRGGDSDRDEAAIDSALQQAATAALGNREGTVIVMDARTGRVRAIVNPPAAYSEGLMPGSAIKPFTALAALRAGLIDENSRTVCPGRFTGLSFSLPCVHADHLPPFNPAQAIAYSCNYYFATLGQRLGRDRLITTLREFDFGQRSGISDREAAGILRPCETGNSARLAGIEANHYAAQADCTAREAVGESDNLQVTPVQLLSAYAALINGGHLYEPKVAGATDFQPVERSTINIASEHRAIIIDGMAGAIRYGTARSAKLDTLPLTIIGKTGTANPAKGFRTNGWFIGFAGPFESNRELEAAQVDLAVLVLLAHAHGSQAAETAKPVFAAYANEIERRGSQARSVSGNDRRQPDKNVSASSRLAASNSTVRVHLVSRNITKELSLEDYVLGVMRAEGTMETEPEGLKALAIAIRTYALKNMGRHAKDGYDFCSTTHCQRFVEPRSSPTVSERPLIAAVQATEGQVLLDDHGQLIDAYFGASCGGETANIGSLWGITPPEYLRGERDEYCETGPHAKWTDTISRADLLRALQSDSRTDVGNRLDHLTVSQRDETGRAEFITLEGEHRKTVRGWDFKIIVGRVLGWNVLKSSRFEVSRSGSNFVFRGSGFGHGLGLCQEGAHVMAQRGASYQKILEKYFPGTRVMPRGGSLSPARPFKAGTNDERNQIVASATTDLIWFQSSLTRQPQWRADVFPAVKGTAKFMRRFAAPLTEDARFLTISSEHFRVTYPTDVERHDADQVLTTLESARSDYLRRASASVSISIPTLEIRLNESTGDFTSRTSQPWWAAGATKGNRIELQPLRILKQRGVLFSTLRHELAHVTIDSVSHNQSPRWLAEGFAIYLAGEGEMISRYLKRGLVSDKELEKRLEHPSSQEEMRSLYAQAYISVAGHVRREGEAALWKQLAAY
jgi:SpoIID/LytB domain protein